MKVFVAICIVLTVLTVFAPNSTPSTLRGKPFKSLDSPLTTKTFHLNLGSERDPSLKWRVDYAKQEVQLEVKFKSSDSDKNDWLAFGFSDRGEIEEADLCVFWVDWKYQVHFDDANTNKFGIMFEDSEQQNCDDFRLIHRGKSNIAFTYRRKFETCDPTDYVIEDGTTHLVFAQGEGPLLRLTGVNATAARHGMKRVQLLKNLSDKASMAARKLALRTVKEINITMDRYHIEPVETTYLCKIFKLPPEFAAKHHMIQYNPVIQEGNEGFVHHMEVFHCEAKYNQKIPDYLGPCAADDKPPEINVCRKVVAAWAMGAEHFVYPEDVGLGIGGENFNPFLMLEVHYNNPDLLSNFVDSSGMQLHYTSKLRRFDAGILEVGLEYTPKTGLPPRMRDVFVRGHCIAECTAIGLPKDGIRVFASQLHTHLTGVRVWTTHSRNGVQLPDINRDNHYSTHYQEIRILKHPVHVLPGDAMVTVCQDTTISRQNITLGGFAISDEMCVNYMHYYPKSNLEVCKSSIDSDVLDEYFAFMNEWEGQPTSAEKTVTENFRSIHWTRLRSTSLLELYDVAPLSMQCNQSSGDRFPGYWEQMPQTRIVKPLPRPVGVCGPYPDDVVPPYYQ